MNPFIMRLLGGLLTALLFAGCSSTPPPTTPPITQSPPAGWQQQKNARLAMENWTLQGKVGIRTPEHTASASLRWQQQGERFKIVLAGPFGQGGATLSGSRYDATLDVAGQRPMAAGSPEELLQYHFGWEFPVKAARFWIKGIPSPDHPYTAQFNSQDIAELHQQGWHIQYDRYITNGHLRLPSKVVISQETFKLTLLIKNWQT